MAVAHGQMPEARAREGDARLRGGPRRRAGGHHHHRERPRHPARQHPDREPRRPLRPRPALPAPRPGGPLRPPRLRLSPGPARHRPLRDRAEAPGRDPRVLRPRRRLPHRRPRPRAARRRQPAGRRAERPHPGGRPRPLREAPRADDPGAARARPPRERPRGPSSTCALDLRIPADYVPEVHQRHVALQARQPGARRAAEVAGAARRDPRPLRRACPPEVEGLLALRGACASAPRRWASPRSISPGATLHRCASAAADPARAGGPGRPRGSTLPGAAPHPRRPARPRSPRRQDPLAALAGVLGRARAAPRCRRRLYNRRPRSSTRCRSRRTRLAIAWPSLAAGACRDARGAATPSSSTLDDQDVVRRSEFERHVAGARGPRRRGPGARVRAAACSSAFSRSGCSCSRRATAGVLLKARGQRGRAARPCSELLAEAVPPPSDHRRGGRRLLREPRRRSFASRRRVTLRQILVPTENEARDVRRRLQKDPKSFETLARSRSQGPGGRRGRPHGHLRARPAAARAGGGGLRPARRGHERRRRTPRSGIISCGSIPARQPAPRSLDEVPRAGSGRLLTREKSDRKRPPVRPEPPGPGQGES